MSQPQTRRPATFEDLLAVPENLNGEIVDGELYTSPRPASRHARAEARLYLKLAPPFEDGDGGPGGWWIVPEPELHLGKDALIPDIAGWRRERVPEYPDVVAWEIAPDWVCEVLSPSTGRLDRYRKLPAYARHRISHAWIVDPIQRTLEVFRLEGDGWKVAGTYGLDDIVRAEPFDAIELPLSTLWIPEPPAA